MTARKPAAALTNPSHKVVGPDGTEFFLIRRKGARLRIKILFAANGFAAGEVSEGWGPTGADDVLMGHWTGPLGFHFGYNVIRQLPQGTHCVEIGRETGEASLHDYQTDILYNGEVTNFPLVRAGFNVGRFGRKGLPVTRPQIAEARAVTLAHKAALIDGTYRRDDGPMIKNTAPDDGGYRPTYVRAEGSPVPADLLAEFVADCDRLLAYLDFLETLPPLPERPRTSPAPETQLSWLRTHARYERGENLRAYLLGVLESGMNDPAAYEAARAADTQAHNARVAQARKSAA
ncbi:hypothetical protein BAJUN_01670 [Bajunvirus bajun]|uniref:Uncharacterized protein n=1 Tax=Brevundimonas phage vB_BgoS-Bajun TaxID=2948594 RepID=A0A9E7SUU8_9CAUD|nr:hypothetical protein BAJUN_01670 [Brevundimonas phage vB_BgoS-Bajun]